MLSLIVAMSRNRVIGHQNQLPWHLPEDLKHFKATTMGNPIIMGRKTFESIGRPLPGRENIVVTRNPAYREEGVIVVHSLAEAIKACGDRDAFVIGGAQLYQDALPLADRLYVTLIDQDFAGDTYFPEIDWEKDYTVVEESELKTSSSNQLPYRFVVMKRN